MQIAGTSNTRTSVIARSGAKKTDLKKQGLNSVANASVQANLMGISKSMKDKNWVDASGRKRAHLSRARQALLVCFNNFSDARCGPCACPEVASRAATPTRISSRSTDPAARTLRARSVLVKGYLTLVSDGLCLCRGCPPPCVGLRWSLPRVADVAAGLCRAARHVAPWLCPAAHRQSRCQALGRRLALFVDVSSTCRFKPAAATGLRARLHPASAAGARR
jgi:hypothetical protein